MKFVHLHTHSHYSLLDGMSKVEDLVQKTKDTGMTALAITDHGNLYAAVELQKKAKAAGVKPIFGVEAYIAPGDHKEKNGGVSDDRYFHLILLVKNKTGWENLLKLVTESHLEGFYYRPRMDKQMLREHHDGLIALSGCLGGEVAQALLKNQSAEAEKIVREYQEIFGAENYYLEIGRHPKLKAAEELFPQLVALSKKTGAPLVATQDSHYLNPEDAPIHDVLLAIQTGKKVSDKNRLSLDDDFSFTPPEQMIETFKDLPEAIENTVKIAEQCDFQIELGKILLPKFDTPNGEDAKLYLRRLVDEKTSRRYPDPSQWVKERIAYELTIIEKTGFADYFLIVQDFINWAKDRGVVVGPGRGSAAGSIISYILGITDLDPIAYDLIFERFLTPDRIQMPDIDIDITDVRRDEVFGYLEEKYGTDRVAHIITFGTMAARAAVRDVGRALDIEYGFCDRLAKLIPFNKKLDESLKIVPELAELYKTDERAKRILDGARRLEGVARHASVHACGTVISAEPLVKRVPLQRSPQKNNVIITQFEMHAIEDLGLLKMDILGLKNLTIIEDTIRLVNELTGEKIDITKIPLTDKKAFALFQRADTTGIFQLECLTGDTRVSNATIEQLYRRQNKSSLRSVYLDSGEIHNNVIKAIVQSGEKKVFRVVAENGRVIKASGNHMFMTDNGWKKLHDLKIGKDFLLCKPKAKHIILHHCINCGKIREISSENTRKHLGFCYSCSAEHFSNPSKAQSRAAISQSQKEFYAAGGKPWNHHLTKETSQTLVATGRKISASLSGVTLEMRYGKERADVMRKRASEKFSGSHNPMFGKKSPHRKGGFREDLGHYVRSNWEADFARILKLHKVQYEYEPRTFTLLRDNGEQLSYTPDFFAPKTNTFYEIKGWLHDLDAEKIKLFEEQYPEHRFVLVDKTKFAEFAMQYKNLVKWECPRVPNQLEFTGIKTIEEIGEEMTYDVLMEAPGNNFIANSFVVHNSGGMRRYLKELKPTELEDIIAMVSLYRPGPMELIPSYIARKYGREKVTYLHPKLEPVLKKTYGIGIYQEQMMRIASDLAGYSLSEADTLRKAIGKKIRKLLQEQEEKLVKGMIKNGIPEPTAKAIWELFPPFARYGFNRSHAACYAMIAYETAYLKANYPEAFMTSLLNSESDDIDRISFLMNECKKMEMQVLPPDINKSSARFSPEGPNIRFGLNAVKNVGENIVAAIIENRTREGEFPNFTTFLCRVTHKDLNKKSLESLIKCGALDSFGVERNQLLANIDEILRFSSTVKKELTVNQTGLFGANASASPKALKLAPAEPATPTQKLAWEKELLGLYVSDHPLNTSREKINGVKPTPIKEMLAEGSAVKNYRIAGMVSSVKNIVTKTGKPMTFAKVEDESGSIEVVVFSDAFAKTRELWKEGNVIALAGRLNRRNGEISLVCEQARAL